MASHGNSNNENLFTKGCGCLLGVVMLAIFLGSLYILIAQPQPLWGRIIGFINGGVTYEVTQSDKSSEVVQSEITAQVKNVGNNEVYIDEKDLTVLLRERFVSFRDITAEIEENKIHIFWKTNQSEIPIIGEAVLIINEQNRLEITQLGTPRFYFPTFSYTAINNMIEQFLSQESVQEQIKLNNSENLEVKDVQFQKDRLYLNIFVDVKLF